ncbi:aminopeptidase [Fictibacillus aquaticus]|uniref:Aminopeptidase n=1 Tax=Fictibacillus aquaticus TaxID=2021314 RepID=A0A235F470_9BACL|nr:aminopeptidase [Fictibacillus aquaticus]OYD56076.1 aminopeptidase [Fictibacillus aquaticus]
MRDPRNENLAKVLLNHSVNLQEGERILIEVSGEGKPLVKELIKQIYEKGAYPYVKLYDEEIARLLAEGATEERMETQKKWNMQEYKDIQASIRISGRNNSREGANIPSEKQQLSGKVMRPVLDQLINHTKWVLLNYPSTGAAQKAGMSLDDFEDFYFQVCTLDYGKMDKAMNALKKLMDDTDEVQIKGEGTDLTFSIKGQGSIKCAGECNIPDGEIYTAPVKDSVNGTITYNAPTSYRGTDFTDIKFVFENGKIIEASANNSEKLNEILDSDEGARYIGEFAIGVNPYILEPMNDILFDEKIAGSFHFTPGQSYRDESYNGNNSQVHWDIVSIQRPEYGGGEMWFDGVLIRKDGLFVPEELQALNPENLK